jgi:hypothetical protein
MEWADDNSSSVWNVSTQQTLSTPETTSKTGTPQWYESGRITIPLYAVIFMLAVVGNTLVILTLVRWRRAYKMSAHAFPANASFVSDQLKFCFPSF